MPGDLQDLSGGWLAALLTGLGVGGTAIYKSFRKVKEDLGDDKASAKADKAMDGILARMESEITRQSGVIVTLTERLDRVDKERSDALAIAAKAQAEVLIQAGKVEALEKDVADLKAELKEVEDERDKLKLRDTGDRRRYTDNIDDRDRRVKE